MSTPATFQLTTFDAAQYQGITDYPNAKGVTVYYNVGCTVLNLQAGSLPSGTFQLVLFRTWGGGVEPWDESHVQMYPVLSGQYAQYPLLLSAAVADAKSAYIDYAFILQYSSGAPGTWTSYDTVACTSQANGQNALGTGVTFDQGASFNIQFSDSTGSLPPVQLVATIDQLPVVEPPKSVAAGSADA